MRNPKKILKFVCFTILATILLITALDPAPAKISLSSLMSSPKDYTLDPKIEQFEPNYSTYDSRLFAPINTPNEESADPLVSPLTSSYLTELTKEWEEIELYGADPLHFAIKRINELKKWGQKITVYEADGGLGSWESLLKEYQKLALKSLKDQMANKPSMNPSDFIKKKNVIYIQKNEITIMIMQLPVEDSKKKYLLDLRDRIFKPIFYLAGKEEIPPQPDKIYYSLDPVSKDKEFGLYNVNLLNTKDMPAYLVNQKIYLKADYQEYELLPSNCGDEFPACLTAKNIKISDQVKTFSINYPKINLLDHQDWYRRSEETANGFNYYLDLDKYPTNTILVFTTKYKTNKPLIFQFLESHLNQQNQLVTSRVFGDYFLPEQKPQYYRFLLEFPDNISFKYLSFNIISPLPLTDSDFSNINIEVSPTWKPDIIIEKTGQLPDKVSSISYKKNSFFTYSLSAANTTAEEDRFIKSQLTIWKIIKTVNNKDGSYSSIIIYKPLYFAFLSFFGLILLISMYFVIKNVIKYPFDMVKNIHFKPYKFLKLLAPVFLSIFIIGFLFDILIYQKISDVYILIMSLILPMGTIEYAKKENNFFFVLGLSLFIISFILNILHVKIMTEKTMIWSYIFFIIGATFTLVKLLRPTNVQNE